VRWWLRVKDIMGNLRVHLAPKKDDYLSTLFIFFSVVEKKITNCFLEAPLTQAPARPLDSNIRAYCEQSQGWAMERMPS
jgi:hypothetical protein